MRTSFRPLSLVPLLVLALASSASDAVDVHDTWMLSQPAVSADHVAFVYADDLWIARLDGTGARRLTSHIGEESSPRFSPDGATIAFTAEYDGNVDVYAVPATGGEPRRLTWHPGEDIVRDFTPDGRVLLVSERSVHTRRHTRLHTVALDGTMPEALPIPKAFKASWSPDGRRIAYVPTFEAFRQWKHYRGGTVARIWIYDVADHSVEQVPQPPGRSNDTDPMWIGDSLWFLSDRDGEFNLYRYEPGSDQVVRQTQYEDFPILSASAGGGRIVYELAGHLYLFDPYSGKSTRLQIGLAADLVEARPRWASGAEWIRDAAISPTGQRAVFSFRGEIVTVPAEHGDPRNLSRSTAAHDRSPAWSPDGRQVAWFSDAGGEYALHVAAQDGSGEVRVLPLDGTGFYADLKWSPDGEKLSFSDNSWTLYWLDLASGETTAIDSEALYGPVKTQHHAWSPDSRWIAYTKNTPTYFQRVHLYSLEEDRSWAITDGLSDVSEPVFDAGGELLYFAASTDAGPVRQWFAMSNADVEMTNALYLAVLPSGVPSPLAPRSDEEEVAPDEEDAEDAAEDGAEDAAEDDSEEEEAEEEEVVVEIDFADLDQRIVALPLPVAYYYDLQPGAAGELFYLKTKHGVSLFGSEDPSALARFSLEEREEKELLDDVDGFSLSHDNERVLLYAGESWSLVDVADTLDPGSGKLAVDAIRVRVEPREEWVQIFSEAWRINRDYFYAPNMHGADWPEMRVKYARFLPHLATRGDLNRVIQWMCSELGVGHHRIFGGDRLYEVETIRGGLLGADYEVDSGRYRFAKVYGGLNWNPELRAPLTEPGVDVRPGEYLLAVDGREVRAPDNLYRYFEATAERALPITVGANADGTDSRTVTVVPIADESALRNRAWVEGNIEKVDAATGGRVAYVHVPNTTRLGHTYFKRYFFPQAHKAAIIVDERYNGGGQVADYYVDILRRPHVAYWAMRYGDDLETPLASIQGPKVMLIDETAGSGGDLLPWMFRKLDLGTLVGKRTWGGLVGILGFPVLMDGGYVTAPNLAIWTADGGWVVENEGVPPDVEVEQWPAEVIAGRDPQLARAIEIVLEQLEANPVVEPERPPYPVRVR